jgi:hypothetical protein
LRFFVLVFWIGASHTETSQAIATQKGCFATHGSNPLNPLDPLKWQKNKELQIADWRKKGGFPADRSATKAALAVSV